MRQNMLHYLILFIGIIINTPISASSCPVPAINMHASEFTIRSNQAKAAMEIEDHLWIATIQSNSRLDEEMITQILAINSVRVQGRVVDGEISCRYKTAGEIIMFGARSRA